MSESFGAALARLRTQQIPRMSLRGLSRLVNYSHVYLWQVEHGEKPVTDELALRCDQALSAGGELLAIAAERKTEQIRQTLDDEVRDRVKAADVQALAHARERYGDLYLSAGGVAIRPRLLELIRNRGNRLLESPHSKAVGRALFRAVASLNTLAGICAFDSAQPHAADRHYEEALRLGRASGDRAFVAYVLMLRASLALRTGSPQKASECAENVLIDPGAVSPALRALLFCVRGEAAAGSGESAASNGYFSEAYRAMMSLDPASEPPETRFVHPGLIEGRHAAILKTAGEIDASIAFAHASVVIGRDTHPRGMANRLIVLASVLIANKQYEEAAEHGRYVLGLIDGMESMQITRRLRGLATCLVSSGCEDSAVRLFCERALDPARELVAGSAGVAGFPA